MILRRYLGQIIPLFYALWSVVLPGFAQYGSGASSNTGIFPWPQGKRAALSLTFDDARPSQIDAGLPLFERQRARVTFYVSPRNLFQRLPQWRQAVLAGHEIGNHSLTHPCTGNFDFSRTNALEDYTLGRISKDIEEADTILFTQLGVQTSGFAYPCGQTFVGEGALVKSYVPIIARRFRSGRLWLSEDANNPMRCDLAQLLGVEMDGKSFGDLRPMLDHAIRRGYWLVLAGHEIGGTGRQTTSTNTLNALCEYAANPTNGLWLDTVDAIARHIIENRPKLHSK
ncbi:MAG TPA: polysaccharide deacetylase family protein [Candidatus Paceibacterota bacterium]|nr:polysaccharide deacetylase family protein [Candidatus Paceibacterota bacterium]HSA02889.1 polysaccharide deacetylase family protein [Candidatus Paceibacterota bacterium]